MIFLIFFTLLTVVALIVFTDRGADLAVLAVDKVVSIFDNARKSIVAKICYKLFVAQNFSTNPLAAQSRTHVTRQTTVVLLMCVALCCILPTWFSLLQAGFSGIEKPSATVIAAAPRVPTVAPTSFPTSPPTPFPTPNFPSRQVHLSYATAPNELCAVWIDPQIDTLSTANPGLKDSIVYYSADSRGPPYDHRFVVRNGATSYVYDDVEPAYHSPVLHRVAFGGLKPDTLYYYLPFTSFLPVDPSVDLSDRQAVAALSESQLDALRAAELEFKSPPMRGLRVPFRFSVVGDIGSHEKSVTIVNNIYFANPDLVLIPGDVTYAGRRSAHKFDDALELFERLAHRKPFMVVVGNHDLSRKNSFKMRFCMPDRGEAPPYHYTFSHGAVAFVALATNQYVNFTEVLDWLEQSLKSIDRSIFPWLVVMHHEPFYTSNHRHEEAPDAELFTRLFAQYHVDLVLSGHVHAYERTHPFTSGTNETILLPKVSSTGPDWRLYHSGNVKSTWSGTIYVTIGTGGGQDGVLHKRWDKGAPPRWSARRLSVTGNLDVSVQFFQKSPESIMQQSDDSCELSSSLRASFTDFSASQDRLLKREI